MRPSHPHRFDAGRLLRRNRRRAWRALWVQVHLYLGLFVGALLVVFGVTGSVLVFFQEIDEWLNPTLLTVEVPAPGQDEYRPVGEILAAAERAAAPGSRITQVYGAPTRERVVAVYVEQPSTAWQRIFVDPYRPVTGVRSYGAGEWVPTVFHGCRLFAAFSTLGRCERRDSWRRLWRGS